MTTTSNPENPSIIATPDPVGDARITKLRTNLLAHLRTMPAATTTLGLANFIPSITAGDMINLLTEEQ